MRAEAEAEGMRSRVGSYAALGCDRQRSTIGSMTLARRRIASSAAGPLARPRRGLEGLSLEMWSYRPTVLPIQLTGCAARGGWRDHGQSRIAATALPKQAVAQIGRLSLRDHDSFPMRHERSTVKQKSLALDPSGSHRRRHASSCSVVLGRARSCIGRASAMRSPESMPPRPWWTSVRATNASTCSPLPALISGSVHC